MIPGLGRSPGEGNGNLLQCSFLENPVGKGAWQATIHGVAGVGYNSATKPPPRHLLVIHPFSNSENFCYILGFPYSSVGKESTCNAGDPGSVPGSRRSPGEGIGYPLQYSGLENSMDCIVHGVTSSQTQLSDFHFGAIS